MLIPINFVSPVWKLHNPYFHIYRCFFYNLARLYDACLGATYAKNDLLRRSHISFLHAHMNHFSKVAVNVVKLFFLFYIHEFILSLIQTSEFGGLCPRQLIDLNISNFEFWMFVLIFSTTTACRKQQQIFDIQNSKFNKSKSMSMCYNMKTEAKTFKSATIEPRKALTNYQVQNGRAQNSLLSSLLCSAIDWFKLWINQWHYIHKIEKVMNSAHD